ncbi:MAG: ATP-binding protein, partial [Thermoplasmata archaeon]
EDMKLALILNAIDPDIGGVLIQGQKGTGKSISVRGLAELLPEIEVISGCLYSCDPKDKEKWCWECKEKYGKGDVEIPVSKRPIRVVELPLNATEDRVVGTIDIEKILTQGLKAFEPGILAEANRGILYIDEINLLDDYIVDVLLDAAAMGVVTVEREAVSVSYPGKFIIVGSMNPEEGALRPQLLDRIALQVKVKGVEDIYGRMEIVKRREEFNANPAAFREKYKAQQEELRKRIEKAREMLKDVTITMEQLELIAKISLSFGVDGHRADIIIERTAKALAAWNGRLKVELEDIIKAAEFALPHRMRKRPFEEEEFSVEKLRRVVEELM